MNVTGRWLPYQAKQQELCISCRPGEKREKITFDLCAENMRRNGGTHERKHP